MCNGNTNVRKQAEFYKYVCVLSVAISLQVSENRFTLHAKDFVMLKQYDGQRHTTTFAQESNNKCASLAQTGIGKWAC
jgi:hypothetical protein